MFTEFANQVWTGQDASVVISDNTDYSIDGTSKKIVWTDALNKTCIITFTAVNFSLYEEICFYLAQRALNLPGDQYEITINGQSFSFERMNSEWQHVVIECSLLGAATTTITITSLVDNLTLFIDVLGYRKVDHNRDIDLLTAFKEAIELDYNVLTTLSAAASAGARTVSLTSSAYVNNTSVLRITNGATTEDIQLASKNGTLKTALVNSYPSGSTVQVICPTYMQDHDDTDPDPICGITVYDRESKKSMVENIVRNGVIHKVFTGALGVLVYIDCSSKKKLLQLAREYDFKYGEVFYILLDGEKVLVQLDSSVFTDDVIGNNPRVVYFYRIEAQPMVVSKRVAISTLNFTLESEPVTSILE